jgi:hypothetical protein
LPKPVIIGSVFARNEREIRRPRRLAQLGLPVKMMIGGVTGWIDEGFALTPS